MAAIEEVLVALEAVPQSDPEAKVEALKALTALVDPSDESYEVQRAAADHAGVLHVLMQLLDDDHEAVVVEAANCLAALSDHAGVVTDRLEAGHFAATPEKVALNPVQEEVGELEGVFSALVNLKFADSEPVASAGNDALAALTSLNRTNTVALVHEVVHRLTQGEARALLALDDLVAGLDVRDDVSVLLDQALSPALGFLRGGAPQERVAAATLLGSIAEGRRGAASYLAAEGALAAAAEMLVEGDLEARDVCAHLVWVLVKGDRKLLSPSKGALGVEGVRLLDPLMELVEKSEGAAERAAAFDDNGGEGVVEASGEGVAVDNGDSALLLLRALAAQDPDVTQALRGEGGLLKARSCAVM